MEEAAASRQALHGVKWPLTSPKILAVDFADEDEVCVNVFIMANCMGKLMIILKQRYCFKGTVPSECSRSESLHRELSV